MEKGKRKCLTNAPAINVKNVISAATPIVGVTLIGKPKTMRLENENRNGGQPKEQRWKELYAVQRSVGVKEDYIMPDNKEDLYRKCRWCKYFDNGKCLKASEIFELPDVAGDVDYAINERGFVSRIEDMVDEEIRPLLDTAKVSEENYEALKSKIIERVQTAVERIEITGADDTALELKDYEHCCKEFW